MMLELMKTRRFQAQGNQLDVLFHSPVEVSRAMYEEHLTDYEVPPRCVPAEYQVRSPRKFSSVE